MGLVRLSVLFVATLAGFGVQGQQEQTFRLCVPHQIADACRDLMAKVQVECVAARDRMECLDKVNAREADFVAVDPEDMYVAYHMANQDFSVFTEFRTKEEPKAEFRYEGILLVRKSETSTAASSSSNPSCSSSTKKRKTPLTSRKPPPCGSTRRTC